VNTLDPSSQAQRLPGGGASRSGNWPQRVASAAALSLVVLGCLCVDHERRSMALTFDEPNHLASGLEWWQEGSYRQWTENPPLARIAVAALPFLHGQRLPAREQWDPSLTEQSRAWEVGGELLYAGGEFEANLGRARLGTLPFYLLTLLVVWVLAGSTPGALAALVAIGFTSTLPALVAHGALATTDVAFVATFLLSVLALWRWFESATLERSLALGAAAALALLAKLTLLVFLPALVAGFVAARWSAGLPLRPVYAAQPLGAPALLRALAAALASALVVTWAGYGFSVGRIDELPWHVGATQVVPAPEQRSLLGEVLFELPLPMPELFHGLLFAAEHSRTPPPAYLLGEVSKQGFLAFYPVSLAVKTPLPFVVALLVSVVFLVRRRRQPSLWLAQAVLLGALGVFVVAMYGRVNLGIRHVLVVLPLAAVAVAHASAAWFSEARGKTAWLAAAGLSGLVVSQAGIALASRSQQLGYVNALAAHDPASVLLDSDLDWGQDLFVLSREARARGIRQLSIAYFGVQRQCEHGLPRLMPLVPGKPATGWVAISENFYRQRNYFGLLQQPCDPESWYDPERVPAEPFAWLRAHQPASIVGTSIRLYHIAAGGEAPPPGE
jgi:4-amino-4-deoxy-L-arabinose transferase-like glycosyltransferase